MAQLTHLLNKYRGNAARPLPSFVTVTSAIFNIGVLNGAVAFAAVESVYCSKGHFLFSFFFYKCDTSVNYYVLLVCSMQLFFSN